MDDELFSDLPDDDEPDEPDEESDPEEEEEEEPLAGDLSLPEPGDEESAGFAPAGSLSFFAPSPEPDPDPLRLSVR